MRSHLSGVNLSFDIETKKDAKNLSGQTYVKDDIANMDDFETKHIPSPSIKVCILIPINLVPNFTHRGRLVIRGRCCSFSQPSAPLGYKQTVSRGR